MGNGKLSLQAEAAITVAALMAAGEVDRLRAEGTALVLRGASLADLREAAYIASLFCGFPRGVAALVELSLLEPGAGEPERHRDVPESERTALRKRGETLFREIHRANAQRQLEMLERVHPDFAETVLGEAYGRVMTRPFLPLPVREMVGVASLSAMGLERQLRAHLLGARNVGASWSEIEEAVDRAAALVGFDPEAAFAAVSELRAR